VVPDDQPDVDVPALVQVDVEAPVEAPGEAAEAQEFRGTPIYFKRCVSQLIISYAGFRKIYDYKNNRYTTLSHGIALQARRELRTWYGVIEAGPEIAKAVLKNRVSSVRYDKSKTYLEIRNRIRS
jgi:hypothetical protein